MTGMTRIELFASQMKKMEASDPAKNDATEVAKQLKSVSSSVPTSAVQSTRVLSGVDMQGTLSSDNSAEALPPDFIERKNFVLDNYLDGSACATTFLGDGYDRNDPSSVLAYVEKWSHATSVSTWDGPMTPVRTPLHRALDRNAIWCCREIADIVFRSPVDATDQERLEKLENFTKNNAPLVKGVSTCATNPMTPKVPHTDLELFLAQTKFIAWSHWFPDEVIRNVLGLPESGFAKNSPEAIVPDVTGEVDAHQRVSARSEEHKAEETAAKRIDPSEHRQIISENENTDEQKPLVVALSAPALMRLPASAPAVKKTSTAPSFAELFAGYKKDFILGSPIAASAPAASPGNEIPMRLHSDVADFVAQYDGEKSDIGFLQWYLENQTEAASQRKNITLMQETLLGNAKHCLEKMEAIVSDPLLGKAEKQAALKAVTDTSAMLSKGFSTVPILGAKGNPFSAMVTTCARIKAVREYHWSVRTPSEIKELFASRTYVAPKDQFEDVSGWDALPLEYPETPASAAAAPASERSVKLNESGEVHAVEKSPVWRTAFEKLIWHMRLPCASLSDRFTALPAKLLGKFSAVSDKNVFERFDGLSNFSQYKLNSAAENYFQALETIDNAQQRKAAKIEKRTTLRKTMLEWLTTIFNAEKLKEARPTPAQESVVPRQAESPTSAIRRQETGSITRLIREIGKVEFKQSEAATTFQQMETVTLLTRFGELSREAKGELNDLAKAYEANPNEKTLEGVLTRFHFHLSGGVIAGQKAETAPESAAASELASEKTSGTGFIDLLKTMKIDGIEVMEQAFAALPPEDQSRLEQDADSIFSSLSPEEEAAAMMSVFTDFRSSVERLSTMEAEIAPGNSIDDSDVEAVSKDNGTDSISRDSGLGTVDGDAQADMSERSLDSGESSSLSSIDAIDDEVSEAGEPGEVQGASPEPSSVLTAFWTLISDMGWTREASISKTFETLSDESKAKLEIFAEDYYQDLARIDASDLADNSKRNKTSNIKKRIEMRATMWDRLNAIFFPKKKGSNTIQEMSKDQPRPALASADGFSENEKTVKAPMRTRPEEKVTLGRREPTGAIMKFILRFAQGNEVEEFGKLSRLDKKALNFEAARVAAIADEKQKQIAESGLLALLQSNIGGFGEAVAETVTVVGSAETVSAAPRKRQPSPFRMAMDSFAEKLASIPEADESAFKNTVDNRTALATINRLAERILGERKGVLDAEGVSETLAESSERSLPSRRGSTASNADSVAEADVFNWGESDFTDSGDESERSSTDFSSGVRLTPEQKSLASQLRTALQLRQEAAADESAEFEMTPELSLLAQRLREALQSQQVNAVDSDDAESTDYGTDFDWGETDFADSEDENLVSRRASMDVPAVARGPKPPIAPKPGAKAVVEQQPQSSSANKIASPAPGSIAHLIEEEYGAENAASIHAAFDSFAQNVKDELKEMARKASAPGLNASQRGAARTAALDRFAYHLVGGAGDDDATGSAAAPAVAATPAAPSSAEAKSSVSAKAPVAKIDAGKTQEEVAGAAGKKRDAFEGRWPAGSVEFNKAAEQAFLDGLEKFFNTGKVGPASPAEALNASADDAASEEIAGAKPEAKKAAPRKKTAPPKPPRKPAVSDLKPSDSAAATAAPLAPAQASSAGAAGKKRNASFKGWSATYSPAAEDAFVRKVKQSFGMETAAPAEAAPVAPSKPPKRQIRKSRSVRSSVSRLGSMRRDGSSAFVEKVLAPADRVNAPVKQTPVALKPGKSAAPEFVFTEPTPVVAAPKRRSPNASLTPVLRAATVSALAEVAGKAPAAKKPDWVQDGSKWVRTSTLTDKQYAALQKRARPLESTVNRYVNARISEHLQEQQEFLRRDMERHFDRALPKSK